MRLTAIVTFLTLLMQIIVLRWLMTVISIWQCLEAPDTKIWFSKPLNELKHKFEVYINSQPHNTGMWGGGTCLYYTWPEYHYIQFKSSNELNSQPRYNKIILRRVESDNKW